MDFSRTDIIAVLPEIIIALGGCALLMLDIFARRSKDVVAYTAIGFVALAAFYTFSLIGSPMTVMAGMFTVDDFSNFFKFIFYIATVLTMMLSLYYLKLEDVEIGEYYALMLFSLCGMMIMASGADLLTIYLGIELMALPIYVLVGFLRKDIRSNEASMKYIILGALSSGILLYGISLVYGVTGTTNLAGIAAALSAGMVDTAIFKLALVMVIAGFSFKIAGFPFHIWAPDAYEGAPTTITAFISVCAKAAAFAAVLRVLFAAFPAAAPEWQSILAVVAVGSMLYGNTVAIAQTNIKRMLAYSSIAHAGYALLGLVAGTSEGVAAVIFYMLVYSFMNMGIFAVIIMMRSQGAAMGDDIHDYTGLAKTRPVAAFLMLLFLFSLAGIPPLAGFMGKFYIFMALIGQGKIALAVVAVIASAIAAYFYIRIVMLMYMKEPEREFALAPSYGIYYVLTITAAAVVLMGIYPGFFMYLARYAAMTL